MTDEDVRPEEEILAVDYITAEEFQSLRPRAKPFPLEHEMDDAECHNCGHPWNDGEEWEEYRLHQPASAGETWKYKCPNCHFQTFECGT